MIKDTTQLHGFSQMKLSKFKGTVEIKLHNPIPQEELREHINLNWQSRPTLTNLA